LPSVVVGVALLDLKQNPTKAHAKTTKRQTPWSNGFVTKCWTRFGSWFGMFMWET